MVGAVKSANLGERASKLRLPEMRTGARGRAARAADDEDARLARLERLAELHEKGVLTDEEFAAEKARVLGSSRSDGLSGGGARLRNRTGNLLITNQVLYQLS